MAETQGFESWKERQRRKGKDFTSAEEVARLLNWKPQNIRIRAQRPGKIPLPFPYIIHGKRVQIPLEPFILWYESEVLGRK